jgi:hypothetical protein
VAHGSTEIGRGATCCEFASGLTFPALLPPHDDGRTSRSRLLHIQRRYFSGSFAAELRRERERTHTTRFFAATTRQGRRRFTNGLRLLAADPAGVFASRVPPRRRGGRPPVPPYVKAQGRLASGFGAGGLEAAICMLRVYNADRTTIACRFDTNRFSSPVLEII